MLDVDVAVDDGLADVEEEEHGHDGEHEADEVASDADVELAISLKSRERVVPAVRGRLLGERSDLLAEALDVLVDSTLKLRLDLLSLDHLDDLLLLFVDGTVLGADLAQTLVDVVVEALRHIGIDEIKL